MQVWRWLVTGGIGLGLCALTLACSAGAAPAPSPTSDAFAVVRATSQAAYATGQALLSRGDLQGCALIDTAKTTDPDNRGDVQQALDQCLATITAQMAAVASSPTALATPACTSPLAGATPGTSIATFGASASAQPRATPVASGSAAWRDPQGRFSIMPPDGWSIEPQPPARFGMGVVALRAPDGQAEVDLAVDSGARVISPELYAACTELVMGQQMPGYAQEQLVPGTTAGNPSIRRVFTFTARDATGRDIQARGFQIAVLKGSTPYIISGSAPAEQFQQYSPTFERVVQSFQFS